MQAGRARKSCIQRRSEDRIGGTQSVLGMFDREELEKALGTDTGSPGEGAMEVVGAEPHLFGHGVEGGLLFELGPEETDGSRDRIIV